MDIVKSRDFIHRDILIQSPFIFYHIELFPAFLMYWKRWESTLTASRSDGLWRYRMEGRLANLENRVVSHSLLWAFYISFVLGTIHSIIAWLQVIVIALRQLFSNFLVLLGSLYTLKIYWEPHRALVCVGCIYYISCNTHLKNN